VLLGEVERLRIEPILVQWIEQQLKAGMVVDRHYMRMNQGVLQGGILSGALANLYLREFDRRCLEVGLPLVRYADDYLVVSGSWMGANRALNLMQGWLEESFLTLQPEKTQIFAPDESFTFLGYQFVAGKVEAPERLTKSVETSKRRLARGATPKEPTKSGGRPPKVCSIVRSPRSASSSSIDGYWREPLTTLYVTDQGAYVRVQNIRIRSHERS